MSFLSLDEASQELCRLGKPVGDRGLIRAAIAGYVLICTAVTGEARSLTKHENVDLCGLYVVPPRYLLEIESRGSTVVHGVFSLDGKEVFSISSEVSYEHLRITYAELMRLESMLIGEASATKPSSNDHAPDNKSKVIRFDDAALRQLLIESETGETQSRLAKKYGVSRQRIGELLKVARSRFKPLSPKTVRTSVTQYKNGKAQPQRY